LLDEEGNRVPLDVILLDPLNPDEPYLDYDRGCGFAKI
jgi:hypothetical protein